MYEGICQRVAAELPHAGLHVNVQQAQPYQLDVEALTALKQQQQELQLQGIDACPRTCPSTGASECKYVCWFAGSLVPTPAESQSGSSV